MREMSKSWAARLGLVALGFAALVGSTVWAAGPVDADPENDNRGSNGNLVLDAADIVDSAGNVFGNIDADTTTWRPGGGYLYISNGGTLADVTINPVVSLSNAVSTLEIDQSLGADTNAYGPVMITGGGTANELNAAGFTMAAINTNVAVDLDSMASASAWGGGAYISRFAEIDIGQSSFANVALNAVISDSGVGGLTNQEYHFNGGALAFLLRNGEVADLNDFTFTGNSVNVEADAGLTGTLTGGFIQANGGALAIRQEELSNAGTNAIDVAILGGSFTNNSVSNDIAGGSALGGAIFSQAQFLTIEDATFTGNSATAANGTSQGGAIYTEGGLTLAGVTFRNNTTDAGANAIYLAGPNASVTFDDKDDGTVVNSFDYDGIAGTGNITMASEGELHLYGDYKDLTGTLTLNDGITFMNDDTITDNAGTSNIDLVIAATGTLDALDRAAGSTLTFNTIDIAAGSTVAVNLGAANDMAGGTPVGALEAAPGGLTVGGQFDLRVEGSIQQGNTYLAIADSGAAAGTGWTQQNFMMTYDVNLTTNGVEVEIDSMQSVAGIGVTRNQTSLGNYLDRNGGLGTDLWDYIYNDAQNEYDVRRALDTSSGDVYASAMGALAQWERRGNENILDRMNQIFWSDTPNAYASAGSNSAYGSYGYGSTDASGIWAEVEGFQFKSDRNNNAGQAKTKGWGVSLGYDKLVADWVFGIAFRYGDSRLDVHERLARVDIDSYSLSLYGGRRACVGPAILHLMGGVTGSYHDMDGRRTQILGPVSNTYTSDYHSKTLSAYADMGATFGDINRFAIQPFGNVMWNGVWSNSFTERGGSASDRLRASSEDDDWWSTSLGIRAMARVNDCFGIDVNAAWRHTYGKLSATNRMRFAGTTGDRFTVRGTPLGRNEGVFGAGLNFKLGDRTYIRAAYDYTVGTGKAQSHEGNVSVGFSF